MRVNVLISTHDREESLKRTVRSVTENDCKDVAICVVVDGNKELFARLLGQPANMILNKERKDYVFSMNRGLQEFEDADFVVYAADDIEFPVNGISLAVKAMEAHFPNGDGLVGLNQNCAGIDSAFGLMGRKFIERFPEKKVFCPDYVHFVSDAELGAFAKSIGKFHFCKEVVLKHERLQHDKTFMLGMGTWGRDMAMQMERHQKGFLWGSNFGLAGNGR